MGYRVNLLSYFLISFAARDLNCTISNTIVFIDLIESGKPVFHQVNIFLLPNFVTTDYYKYILFQNHHPNIIL